MASFIINSYDNSFEISQDGHTKEFQRGILSYDDDPNNDQILDINTTQSRQQLYRIDLNKDTLNIDGSTTFANAEAIKTALRPFFFRNVGGSTPGGGVQTLGVSAPITDSGTATDPIIGVTQSSSVSDGYLSSTDWNTFNNKLDSIAISDEVIPKGTGTSIENGSWQFFGNDILPITTGSNIGADLNRIGTIYMSSVIDYSTDLVFSSTSEKARLTTSGLFGLGINPTHTITVQGSGEDLFLLKDQLGVNVWEFEDNGQVNYRNYNFINIGGAVSGGNLNHLSIGKENLDNYTQGLDQSDQVFGFGFRVFKRTTSGTNFVGGVGYKVFENNTVGNENYGFGSSVFPNNTTGFSNFGFGRSVGNGNTTGSNNIAIGRNINLSSASTNTLSFSGNAQILSETFNDSIHFGANNEYRNIYFGEGNGADNTAFDFNIYYNGYINGRTDGNAPNVNTYLKPGTGAGTGGKGVFKGTPSGAPGTTQNPYVDLFVIDPEQGVKVENVPFILPFFTTTERDALTPIEGMCIANTTTNNAEYYNGSAWVIMA